MTDEAKKFYARMVNTLQQPVATEPADDTEALDAEAEAELAQGY